MACMEHCCYECGTITMDNNPYSRCPFCGGACSHTFDEDVHYERIRDREDEEEDE